MPIPTARSQNRGSVHWPTGTITEIPSNRMSSLGTTPMTVKSLPFRTRLVPSTDELPLKRVFQ